MGVRSVSSQLALIGALSGLMAQPLAAGQAATATTQKIPSTKPWTPPLTPDGHPDLQGIWVNNGATPLERPPALAGRQFLTDEEVAAFKRRAAQFRSNDSDAIPGDNVYVAILSGVDRFKSATATGAADDQVERDFDNRTSLIVDPPDGRIPYTTEGRRREDAAAALRARPWPSDPENLPNYLRCLTFGLPRVGLNGAGYNSYYQIVQAPGFVVLFGEVIHDARVIAMDGRPHLPTNVALWEGDSRGRWEGQTLVVETTNLSPKSYFFGSSEHLHLVERFTRTAADTIDYEITVSDPGAWTRPWTAVVHLKQSSDQMFEYACHEGNERTMIDMLLGARAAERAAEAPAVR